MNDERVRAAAAERLLDASLRDVCSAQPGRTLAARPRALDTEAVRSNARRFVAAALVLAASIVVASVWLLQRAPAPAQLQEPAAPLPPAVRVEGSDALKAVDAATVNIDWEDGTVADLPLLARLPSLRRLRINPDTGPGLAAWKELTVEQLEPLCGLPALEEIGLPFCAPLSPAHLRRLAVCRQLRAASFNTDAFALDAETVAALATWPALRELRLLLVELRPEGVAALASLPHLTELELWRCFNLEEAELATVSKLRELRRLSLIGLGQPDIRGFKDVRAGKPTWALTTAAMQQIAAMPALRALELKECTLDAALLKGLPHTLTSLAISGPDLDAACVQALRRLDSVRSLNLHETGADEEERAALRREVAGLVGSLHLQQFAWHGALSPELRDAVAAQADLRQLEVAGNSELAFAVRLPKLERLDLWPRLEPGAVGAPGLAPVPPLPSEGQLEALRACKSLRVVAYHDVRLADEAAAALRQALGPRIALHLVE